MLNARKPSGNAEILALEALGWLAADQEVLGRFLALSGLDPDGLRQAAGSPGMAGAVLDFLLSDEALLLRFCESTASDPRAVAAARARLD